MTNAYSELYLNDAMESLGSMFEYAVLDCGYDADKFFEWFIHSGIADEFGRGNPKYVAGLSGIELAMAVVHITTGEYLDVVAIPRYERSNVYWAAWSIAYYQWYTGERFKDLYNAGLNMSSVMKKYILHEADLSKFVKVADDIIMSSTERSSHLKTARLARGLTQKELSEMSGVGLRMIQLYEQQQSDINGAAVNTVLRLSNVLGCDIRDIME